MANTEDEEFATRAILNNVNDLVSDTNKISGLNEADFDPQKLSGLLGSILASKLPSSDVESGDDSCDPSWRFVTHSLLQLSQLGDSLSSLPSSFLLSVKETQSVTKLLQLCVALGVLPSLGRGVGLAPEKRSKFMQMVQKEEKRKLDVDEQYRRLVHVLHSLLHICQHPTLNNIVVSKHLGDLLSALIQLGHCPLKKPNEGLTLKEGEYVMTEEKYAKLMKEQEFFRGELAKVIERVYQPSVVKFLLVIQSSGASNRRDVRGKPADPWCCPKWLKATCGALLSDRLAKPGGVLNVIRGVLDIGSGEVMQTQKYAIVAQVLANPPAGRYKDLEDYYKHVCPQILDLLALKDTSESKSIQMVACACVRSISERSLILSRRYLLDRIMAPFLSMNQQEVKSSEGFSDEEEAENEPFSTLSSASLSASLLLLHRIFVVCSDPSPVFLGHLEPVMLVLLELHCAVTYSASHLKNPVEEILKRYIKCVGNVEAVGTLRAFAFKSLSYLPTDRPSRLRLPMPNLRFTHGDDGSLSADLSDPSAAEESFYVADDERSIALVDLVETKDKRLATDLFMTLLKDLSDVMGDKKGLEKMDQVSKVEEELPLMAPSGTEESARMEAKLRAFEKELDETMATLRRNLMVIRLLGLMSEDEKLQDNLIKDSEQLLDFVCLTLKRGATSVTHRMELLEKIKNKKATDDDEDDGGATMLEIQSLTMALTLLNLKVTSADIQVVEWERLQLTLDDLRLLAGAHSDERVRSMSKRLRTLIATHGVILDSKTDMVSKSKKILSAADKIHGMTEDLKKMHVKAKEEQALMDQMKADLEDEDKTRTPYEEALYTLTDPLLPIRGHGLIQLTRLVTDKDKQTVDNIGKVVDIFKEHLEEDDTYLYLQAIYGLVAAANLRPEPVIDLLTKEFAHADDRRHAAEPDKAMEIRTKLGEALVRVTRDLQQLTPAYKDKLLNPFLGQLGHADELVRASCLSNLGEVCKNLRFSLGPISQEIFQCLEQILTFDKAIEVRRAAVLVIKMLLQGLGSDAFNVLKDSLRQIWKGLLHLRDSESDSAMLVLVNSAIDEVDQIVKKFMNPTPVLKKNIFVLDTPPDAF